MNAIGGEFARQFSVPTPDAEPAREWFSLGELAELRLPGLPHDKRGLSRRAGEERWHLRCNRDGAPLCRPRSGRGGGNEYHLSLLPGAARVALAGSAAAPALGSTEAESQGRWRWYEAQSGKTKAEAERRMRAIAEIELLEGAGLTATAAVAEVALRTGQSTGTLWNWRRLIDGVARHDRLPALAPRYTGGGKAAEIDPEIWRLFKSDYLRPSCPTLASCYARVAEIAAERGLSLPSQVTFRRRFEAEVDVRVVTLRREGEEALRRKMPSQRRDVSELEVLQLVNADGHKFDVWVNPPPDHTGKVGKPIRPVMVAIQDVRSAKVLAWRIGIAESAALVRLAFHDLFENHGIPQEVLLDNGRGFASKWITGAQATRFRFKIKPEDPTGLLTALGIKVHWAQPYRGQSKPIERAFRDLCDTLARHPATEGAYAGNSVANKPHNWGERAMGWDEFLAHADRQIAFHNARLGRRGRDYRGRSFDQVFAEGLSAAKVGKATEGHLRMALLTAEQKTVDRRTGEVVLFGNRYWSQECGRLAGRKVTVRFDPDNLLSEIHLYDQAGAYLTSAQVWQDSGFLSAEEARLAKLRWKSYRKLARDAAEAEDLLLAEQVAAAQAGIVAPEPVRPAATRMVRHRGQTAAALKVEPQPQPQRESRVFAALGKLKAVE